MNKELAFTMYRLNDLQEPLRKKFKLLWSDFRFRIKIYLKQAKLFYNKRDLNAHTHSGLAVFSSSLNTN
jgi:hypothetical protein